MSLRHLLIVFLTLLLACSVQAKTVEKGAFLVFLNGIEAGREDFVWTEQSLETTGAIAVGAQNLAVTSVLRGTPGNWKTYQISLTPGALLTAKFREQELGLQIGPVRRRYKLERPYVVLDNNVFSHYQLLLGVLPPVEEKTAVCIVIPSLLMLNKEPLIQGELARKGTQLYSLAGRKFMLQEYTLTLPGNLEVYLWGSQDNKLICLEIPSQQVRAIRQEYLGLEIIEQ